LGSSPGWSEIVFELLKSRKKASAALGGAGLVDEGLIGLASVDPEAGPVGSVIPVDAIALLLRVPPIVFPFQVLVRVRFPLICPLALSPDSLLS
jgi:hypothetical protein